MGRGAGTDREDEARSAGATCRRQTLVVVLTLLMMLVAFGGGFHLAGGRTAGGLAGRAGGDGWAPDHGAEDDGSIDGILADDGPSWWSGKDGAEDGGETADDQQGNGTAAHAVAPPGVHPTIAKVMEKADITKLVTNALRGGEIDEEGRHYKPVNTKNVEEVRAAGKNLRLTEKEWKHVQDRKMKAQMHKLSHAVQLKQISSYYDRGNHYWKAARAALPASDDVRVVEHQCFLNATKRRHDFWSPVAGEWTLEEDPLPIYDAKYPGTDVSKCYAQKQKVFSLHKKKKGITLWDHETKYDCGASSEMTSRLIFNPRPAGISDTGSCRLIPLLPDLIIKRLKNRRIWFFGDYVLKQQYEALACNIALHQVRAGTSHAGKRTGGRSIFSTYGQNEATSLFYTYVGHYRKDPSVEAVNVEVQGLGDEIKHEFGVNADVAAQLNNAPSPHRIGLIDLADAIEERMEDFLATDIIVTSYGSDFEETRDLQSSLLKFLRLYEEHNERLPIVLWRELTAQHHLGFRGGDILQPLQKSKDGILIPEGDAQPDAPLSEKYKSAIPVVRLEMSPGEKANRIKCGPIPFAEMELGNWRNKLANRLMEAAGIPIMRVWEATTKRHDWYKPSCPGGLCDRWGPCMYYCSPGVPTFLNEVLFTFLQGSPVQDALAVRKKETIPDEAPPPPPAPPREDGGLVDRPAEDVKKEKCHDQYEFEGIRMKGYCNMVEKMKQGKFPELDLKGSGKRSPITGVPHHYFLGDNKRQWKEYANPKLHKFEELKKLNKKLKKSAFDE